MKPSSRVFNETLDYLEDGPKNKTEIREKLSVSMYRLNRILDIMKKEKKISIHPLGRKEILILKK